MISVRLIIRFKLIRLIIRFWLSECSMHGIAPRGSRKACNIRRNVA